MTEYYQTPYKPTIQKRHKAQIKNLIRDNEWYDEALLYKLLRDYTEGVLEMLLDKNDRPWFFLPKWKRGNLNIVCSSYMKEIQVSQTLHDILISYFEFGYPEHNEEAAAIAKHLRHLADKLERLCKEYPPVKEAEEDDTAPQP